MNKHTAEKILTLATSLGTDASEVYLRSYSSTVIEVKEQKVDAFERANDIGAGLRVIVGERMGFAFTTDLSDIALRNLVHASVANAQNTEPDPFHSLPGKSDSDYPEVAIYDPDVVKLTEKEKIDRIMAMERDAFAVDPRIKRIHKASADFSDAETLIMNTGGAGVLFKSTACS